ncbi:MAG: flavodoxin family protein [Proteobacteria bacterium]|nr:flavodoxin family protein [Pseudomonadota bacterium]
MKRIIIIDASPRQAGNCKVTADYISTNAKDALVEIFPLRDKFVRPCMACDACKRNEVATCVQKDDMTDLLPRLDTSDAIVFLSPIYFGQITGPAKTFIDRLYCYFHPKYPNMSLSRKRDKKLIMIGFCGMGDAESYKNYLRETVSALGVIGVCEYKVLLCNQVNEPGSCMRKPTFMRELNAAIDSL